MNYSFSKRQKMVVAVCVLAVTVLNVAFVEWGIGGDWQPSIGIPSVDHTVTGIIIVLTAGETLTYGDICYLNSNGKYYKANANSATTMPVRYIAAANITASATGYFLKMGYIRDDSWTWTVGGELYASASAGLMTHTQPSTSGYEVQSVGYGETAHVVFFNPNDAIVTIA